MKYAITLILVSLLSWSALYATHNRAGEITYRHISGTTYQITVNIFSDPTSPAFARREIVINYGDNTSRDSISQTNVDPELTPNIQKRSWVVFHTFPGPGNYTISVTDPNRSGDVDNINNPSGVPFYLESLLRISPLGNLRNNSPTLQNDPIDNACAGQVFIHNPGAVDPDGDSLAYELAPSYGVGGNIAPGYTPPPSTTPIYVNALTGDLVMDVPNAIGLFNVGIRIKEYRNGILIGNTLRDLQVQVFPGCNNSPPVITANTQYCVEAGNRLSFVVIGTDPNQPDRVSLSATGEPIDLGADFRQSQSEPANPISANFNWRTNCAQARKKPYDLSVRAEDNAVSSRNAPTNLVSFRTIGIRVIAPGPENAVAQKSGTGIQLNWDNIACPNASGFRIYRRVDSSGYQSSNCIPGVPDGIGYELIHTMDGVGNTTYLDNNEGEGLVPERKYCYLITKYFDDGDESYVSNEVCAEIDKIIPIMTNVSVVQTATTNGQIQLGWSPPDTIDPVQSPPPYRYLIEQRTSNDARFVLDSTNSLNDTTYLVNGLNTEDLSYEYRVALVSLGSGRRVIGFSTWAPSIYLRTIPSDNRVRLDWNNNTPWINNSFVIYRRKSNSNQFDSLAIIDSTYFIDQSLTNGSEYCYYIKTIGAYQINSVDSPLINLSQISCATPIDNIPPCAPTFSISGDCEFGELELRWAAPRNLCDTDLIGYRIYRSRTRGGEFELIEEIQDPNENTYRSSGSIAGCYYVAAIDSVFNESVFSNSLCIDYCPIYELPNIFTPNGDGVNDLFVPRPNYRYVDSIDLQIYNRWDQLIFQTSDPDINWNGLNKESNELVSDGIYFYICQVFERTIDGRRRRIIKGTVTVVDSKEAQNFE